MTKKWLAHGLGLLIVAACAGVESGGEFASGRRALMSGDSAVALTYFEPIAKRDHCRTFSSLRSRILTSTAGYRVHGNYAGRTVRVEEGARYRPREPQTT